MATRIQKAMAHLGLGSRRHCERMVLQGRVTLDGVVVQVGQTLTADEIARIELDGQTVGRMPQKRYLLLNKPGGYVTTVSDPQGRPTVMDLLGREAIRGEGRVYPVGRLDRDTLGVLLFTNDGELAHGLLHPSSGVEKEYRAKVGGAITPRVLQALKEGPELEDGPTRAPKRVATNGQNLTLVIKEGRKRQVRRMLKAVGLKCLRLERIRFAHLSAEGVPEGSFRELSSQEVKALKKLCGGSS